MIGATAALRTSRHSRRLIFPVLLGAPLFACATEYHGRVFFGGVAVPGATVTLSNGDKHLSTVTDRQGLYQFPDIAAGTWSVRIEMQGFATRDDTVSIASGTPAGIWEVKLLGLEQMLAIARAAPLVGPAPLTPRPSPGETRRAAKDLPKTPDEPATPEPSRPNEEAAGSSADGLLINGSENNAATSKYSLSPAFGNRRAGSRALYNGSLGAIVSNSVFDARPYSLTGLEVPKASYSRVTSVFTLGGPLNIPHLMPHGPNFFIAYQWTRNREATTLSGLVPTAAARSGDLSGLLNATGQPVSIFDPATGRPLTGPLPVSPQAQALLRLYPLPNLSGSTRYNYQTQVLNNTHEDALQSRLDKGFGRRDQVYGNFALRSARADSANLFQFRDTTNTFALDTSVNWSHRFPHSILFVLGYRFSRLRNEVRPNFQGQQNISGTAGIEGNAQDPTNWGPPDLVFSSGLAALTDVQSAFNRNRTDALSGTATWTHRRHTTVFGADFRRQEFNQFSQQNARGAFTFTGTSTQNGAVTNSGSDFADFLLGVPDTSRIAFGNPDKYLRQSVYDGFLSDDWRLKPELTLNAGLRWDYGAPLTELKGRLVNLDVLPGFTAVRPVLGSSPVGALTGATYPTSLVRPDKRNFQPRVGLSWRPFPTSTMVVRAGYGIYVDTSVYLTSTQQMAQQSPLSKSLSVANSNACPLTLANGFRDCAGTTANTFALDPDFRVGYAQTWRLSVQRDLPAALVMTATYLGAKGSHGPQEFLPNTYPLGANDPCPLCPSGFVYRTSNGNSIRHAGELQLRRRLRSGITATLDYVYAKSIDNDSDLGGQGHTVATSNVGNSNSFNAANSGVGTSTVIAQNWLDLHAERSRSNLDQRHLLKLQFQYTSGMGLSGGSLLNGWRGKLLKQWTVAGQLAAGSGLPETPVYLAAVPGTGFTGSIRGSRTGAPVYTASSGYFLNAAAFSAPAPGQWGDAGRNSITGPGQLTLDSSLARTFKLRDPLSLDVRLDSTNLLNHVVFTSWNAIINSTTFGLPAGTNAMRSLQITGRLRF